jgi:hypothetical protein
LSEVVSIARSVHFSPNTSQQSRGFTESRAIYNTFSSMDQNGSPADSTLPESSSSLEEGNARVNPVVNPNAIGPERHGRIMISRVGRRGVSRANRGLVSLTLHAEPYGTSQHPRDSMTSGASLSTAECSHADPSEDISLEVRHEHRTTRVPRRPSLVLPMSTANSRRRSKSDGAEPTGEHRIQITKGTTVYPLPQTRPVSDGVLDRRKVLSALDEIGGGKRKLDPNTLEVSVVTEMGRRIERKAPRQEELLDDYHGRRYDRRGRSWSSSGGF